LGNVYRGSNTGEPEKPTGGDLTQAQAAVSFWVQDVLH
jgi:hypothetical protein